MWCARKRYPEGVFQKSYSSLFSVFFCHTLALMIGKERGRVVVKIQVVEKCCEGVRPIKKGRSSAEKRCGKIMGRSVRKSGAGDNFLDR